jgi:L-iditol 2-dehydrogenase
MKGIKYDLSTLNIVLARTRIAGMGAMMQYRADWPDPGIAHPNQVLARTLLGGICATDLHQLKTDMSYTASILAPPVNPFPMGHELVARVEEVGAGVSRLGRGDRVVLNPVASCEAYGLEPCPSCRVDDEEHCLCLAGAGDGSSLEKRYRGSGSFGGMTGGGFCELVLAFEKQLFKVPESMSDETAVLAEPLAVALHAVARNMPPAGRTTAVIGGGIIGLLTVAALRLLQPDSRILALTRYAFQTGAAKKLGADGVIAERDREALYEEVAEKTGGRLFKPLMEKKTVYGRSDLAVVFDTVATEESMEDALRLVSSGGRVVAVGMGYTKTRHVDWSVQIYKEVEVAGAFCYGMESRGGERVHAFDMALGFLGRDPGLFDGLVTHTFPIERYRKALACASAKGPNRAVKVAFDFRT